MSLKERLLEDMKQAMKAREEGKVRLSVIRMVKSAIKYSEIECKHDLSDAEVQEVIAHEVKKRRDAIDEYRKVGKEDAVKDLEVEIDVLMPYLPAQLSEQEIRALVHEAVLVSGAKTGKDMGSVMKVLMPKVKGKADGKLVNSIVKEILQ